MYTFACLYIHLYVHVCIRIHIRTNACMNVCVRNHHAHTPTHSHTHMHSPAHTQTYPVLLRGPSLGSVGSSIGQFLGPTGLALSMDNVLAVADCGNHRVQVFDLKALISTSIPLAVHDV